MRLEYVRKTPHDHVRDDERDRERQVQQPQNGRVGHAGREESGVKRMEKNQAKQNEAPTTPATR